MITIKQFTTLIAKENFRITPPKNQPPQVKRGKLTVTKGQAFIVTNSTTGQALSGFVMIDRKKSAHIGIGYPFTPNDLITLFDVT